MIQKRTIGILGSSGVREALLPRLSAEELAGLQHLAEVHKKICGIWIFEHAARSRSVGIKRFLIRCRRDACL